MERFLQTADRRFVGVRIQKKQIRVVRIVDIQMIGDADAFQPPQDGVFCHGFRGALLSPEKDVCICVSQIINEPPCCCAFSGYYSHVSCILPLMSGSSGAREYFKIEFVKSQKDYGGECSPKLGNFMKKRSQKTDLVKKLTKFQNSAWKLLKNSYGFVKIGKDWIGDIQKLSL